MRLRTILMAALAALVLVLPARAEGPVTGTGGWSMPRDYTFFAPSGCGDADKGAKRRSPVRAIYDVCADQMKVFLSALEEARKQGKLLLVEFGGTWCPWCGKLQKQLPGGDVLGWTGAPLDMTRTFHHVDIGISTTYRGEREEVLSGKAVADMLLARAPAGSRIRALPYLAVVDPSNPGRVFARNVTDIPLLDTHVYDPAVLRIILGGANDYLRNGGPPPTEPGWLKRKIQGFLKKV